MPGSGDGIGMACVWGNRIDRLDYSKRQSMHDHRKPSTEANDRRAKLKWANQKYYNPMDEDLMLKLSLDTLMWFALQNPSSLTPYTQEMADEIDELLAGVTVDED
jgi:hypothetical protein